MVIVILTKWIACPPIYYENSPLKIICFSCNVLKSYFPLTNDAMDNIFPMIKVFAISTRKWEPLNVTFKSLSNPFVIMQIQNCSLLQEIWCLIYNYKTGSHIS